MADGPAIGIDLGTTFSSVGVWVRGRVEIITNEQGKRITPSYVAFNETEVLVGDAAKNQAALNPENTVFDAKRLIGRSFHDKHVQEDMNHWPFTVCNIDGAPFIEVMLDGKQEKALPEGIAAIILMKLKEEAEAYLEQPVRNAVIAVPAYFNNKQRQATKDAGEMAGLNIISIINEPTAGALAYGLNKQFRGQRNVLIYDLGGGTFDVSIVTINEGAHFAVRATGGDNHLGGEDFDNRLVNHFIEEFKNKWGHDITSNPKAIGKLKLAAEKTKHLLSNSMLAPLHVDALHDNIDFIARVSRAKFESICLDLFQSTLDHIKKTLLEAQMEARDIDEIVLIGGSSRIPKIQKMLQEFFQGKKLNYSLNPDEAVAYGAAVRAAALSENSDDFSEIDNVVLEDLSSLTLGIETKDETMSRIIERNSRIPCKKYKRFTTLLDYQRDVEIKVYEGESEQTKDNHLLGKFTLTGINPALAGVPKIDVTFELDESGILIVTAVDSDSQNSNQIVINKE